MNLVYEKGRNVFVGHITSGQVVDARERLLTRALLKRRKDALVTKIKVGLRRHKVLDIIAVQRYS